MKIFFDMEFTGLHKKTTPISIGMIASDGRRFYGEFTDYDKSQVDDWVKDNVISNLKFNGEEVKEVNEREVDDSGIEVLEFYSIEVSGTSNMISSELDKWLRQFNSVELVSDVCHYDMVLLLDILKELPSNMSPVCHDINQDIAEYYSIPERLAFDMSREKIVDDFKLGITGEKHNALYDAEVISTIYFNIMRDKL